MRIICQVGECEKDAVAKGYCFSHYNKFKRYGDPMGGRQTPNGAPLKYIFDVLGETPNWCVFWPYTKSNGYGMFRHEGGKMDYAHRFICFLTHGKAPSDVHEAAHSCGNGHLGCVNHRHLRWATVAENQHDKIGHGTHPQGVNHPGSLLTEQQVLSILSERKGESATKIAREFGVHPATIRDVQKGRRWRHIELAKINSRFAREVEEAVRADHREEEQ